MTSNISPSLLKCTYWVCVSACVCVWVWRTSWVSFFRSYLLCFWDRVSCLPGVHQVGWNADQQGLGLHRTQSPSTGVTVACYHPWTLVWNLGLKLKSSCLGDKNFTRKVISQVWVVLCLPLRDKTGIQPLNCIINESYSGIILASFSDISSQCYDSNSCQSFWVSGI